MSVQEKQFRLWSILVGYLTLSLSARTAFVSVSAAPLKGNEIKTSATVHSRAANSLLVSPSKRFERLRKASGPWAVLQDPQVKAAIHAIMGNKDEEYWGRTQLLDDSYSSGDDLLIAGDVRGFSGSMVSLFYLNYSTGKLLAGYVDDSKIHLFGVKGKADVPQVMNEYANKALAGKTFVFDLADFKPVKNAETKTKAAPLNLAKLTGTYERKDGRFIYSTMMIEQLPGSQIKFQIYANNGGNSGQAAGTIKMVEQCGRFKEADSEIQLKFSGGKVVVSGNDSYFCGNAVTLLGTYVRTSDGAPKFDND
ncbi:hypothetical protein KBI23_12485 [bacterium]|nr:hypothetical protein [bacterium]